MNIKSDSLCCLTPGHMFQIFGVTVQQASHLTAQQMIQRYGWLVAVLHVQLYSEVSCADLLQFQSAG